MTTTPRAPPPSYQCLQYEACLGVLNSEFTTDEVRTAATKCNSTSSPGEDGLPMSLMLILSRDSVASIAILFNACLHAAEVPTSFKAAIVTPLPKHDPSQHPQAAKLVANYRGISVTASLSKVLEKCMEIRTEAFIAVTAPLSMTQMGFRPGMWTSLQVYSLVQRITELGPNCLAFFFDIKACYPSVRRSSLLRSLYDRGVVQGMLRLIAAFYRGTAAKVRCGPTYSQTYEVHNGLKEGSILSCLIFLSWICQLIDDVSSCGLGEIKAWADDLAALPVPAGFVPADHGCPRPTPPATQVAPPYQPPAPSPLRRATPPLQLPPPGMVGRDADGSPPTDQDPAPCHTGITTTVAVSSARDSRHQAAQALLHRIGTFMTEHMMRCGWLKTACVVFNPDPNLPTYPPSCHFEMSGMVHGTEDIRRVRVVHRYEYLGVWLDEYLTWAYHITKKVIPTAVRTIGRISRIATHDVLNPAASMKFIETDVMAAVTYGCDMWGRSLWCPQNSKEAEAIEKLEKLFLPMLKDVINVDHRMASSTATMLELAWFGVKGAIVIAQLRHFRSTMALADARNEPAKMLQDLRRVHILPGGLPAMPPTTTPPAHHRLTHYYDASSAAQSEVADRELAPNLNEDPYKDPATKLLLRRIQLGPATPSKEYLRRRIAVILGLTPGAALTTTSQGRKYSWTHLKYDIQHGYVVIPVLEASPAPRDYDIHGTVPTPKRDTIRQAGSVEPTLRRHYWRIKKGRGMPCHQRVFPTTYAASLLTTLHRLGGPELVGIARSAAVAMGSKHKFKTSILFAAEYALARTLWSKIVYPSSDHHRLISSAYASSRLNSIRQGATPEAVVAAARLLFASEEQAQAMYPGDYLACRYASSLGFLQRLAMSPHLMCIPVGRTSTPMIDLYSIVRARVGALALGAHVDRFLPPLAPYIWSFCPCCQWPTDQHPILDVMAHHLCGQCNATVHLACTHLKRLLRLLRNQAPDWYLQYGRASSPTDRAALLMSSPDQPFSCPYVRQTVTLTLATWLSALSLSHPLCAKQLKGLPIMSMAYRGTPFMSGPWTSRELGVLKRHMHDDIQTISAAVPTRSRSACKRKHNELTEDASVTSLAPARQHKRPKAVNCHRTPRTAKPDRRERQRQITTRKVSRQPRHNASPLVGPRRQCTTPQ